MIMRRSKIWGVIALLMGCGFSIAQAAVMKVGNPKNPADLARSMEEAYEQGARDITLTPGTYHLPASKTGDSIRLTKWNDTTIHAWGVTLVFEDLAHRPLHFIDCKNVTWDGGLLRFARPAFTQGRITAVSSDTLGEFTDWQVDAGYFAGIDPVKSTFNAIDPRTRGLKAAVGDWRPRSCQTMGPGLFRLRYITGGAKGFAVSDRLVTRAPGGTTIAHLDGCENCTLRNVTFENGGFATLFETKGKGGNHYLNCTIQPGPRPAGATEDELVGGGADGFHSVGTATGPDIEDCTFTGVFLDDCIAIHGSFHRVVSSTGSTLVILSRPEDRPAAGDTLRVSNPHGFFAQAKCTAVEALPNDAVKVTLDQTLNLSVDSSSEADPHKGTKAGDPGRCGRGFRILRCHLGNTRSRGILAKADDGLIDHCQIEGCAMSGVSLGPEYWWGEADYSWNVTISNNTFRSCSKNNYDQGSIWVHGEGAIGNRNITIDENRFENCYGQYVMRIEFAAGVRITHNQIDGSFPIPAKSPGHVVWLAHDTEVELMGNAVTNQGSHAGEIVGLAADMNPAEVRMNSTAP